MLATPDLDKKNENRSEHVRLYNRQCIIYEM